MKIDRYIMALGLVLGGGIAPVMAHQPDTRTRELVNELASQAWLERDLATHELINFAEDISLDELEHFLLDPALTLEQRTRLVFVCVQRFAEHPKGGLGVSFGQVSPGSIEVMPIENNPRFPASAMLNPGDAIAKVDGVMMMSTLDLRLEILSREPGEVLPVTVIRAGRLVEMELPLGSFNELVGGTRLDPIEARRALERRWARKGIVLDPPETIGSGITKEHWARAAFPPDASPNARATTRRVPTAMVTGPHQLVRTGPSLNPRRFIPWASPERIYERAVEIMMILAGQRKQVDDAHRGLLEREIRQLVAELEALENKHDTQRLQAQIDELSRSLDALDAQGNGLPAEASP